MTDAHSPFEQGKGLGRSPWRRDSRPNHLEAEHQAPGMLNRLGNPEPFFPEGTALSEQAQLGMTLERAGHGRSRRVGQPPKRSWRRAPSRDCHRLPEAVDRPTIVTLGLVGDRGGGSPARARRSSPLAVASARARWPAAIAWSYVPMRRKWNDRKTKTCPSRPWVIEGCQRGSRPRAGMPEYAPNQPDGWSTERRASRRSIACSSVSRCSGRCERALSACSKYPTASR